MRPTPCFTPNSNLAGFLVFTCQPVQRWREPTSHWNSRDTLAAEEVPCRSSELSLQGPDILLSSTSLPSPQNATLAGDTARRPTPPHVDGRWRSCSGESPFTNWRPTWQMLALPGAQWAPCSCLPVNGSDTGFPRQSWRPSAGSEPERVRHSRISFVSPWQMWLQVCPVCMSCVGFIPARLDGKSTMHNWGAVRWRWMKFHILKGAWERDYYSNSFICGVGKVPFISTSFMVAVLSPNKLSQCQHDSWVLLLLLSRWEER